MAGHSILYLGHGEFAAEYLSELETLPCCTMLTRAPSLDLPAELPSVVDIIMLEAGPNVAQAGKTLSTLIRSFGNFPVVALTQKRYEHRGIAAVRAGAEAYICTRASLPVSIVSAASRVISRAAWISAADSAT